MPLFSRFDGDLVTNVPPTRAIMPYLMPSRASAVVYFEQNLDVTKAYAWLDAQAERAGATGKKATFFHLFTYALVRTLSEHPRLNRFTMGHHLYQRKKIEIAFSAKKAMNNDSPIVVVKRDFTGVSTFEEHSERLAGGVAEGRSKERSSTDKELDLFLAFPGFLLAFFVAFAQWLDRRNLLPKALIAGDPMYASIFVANLGSVGLEAAYHHLFEWGNCPIFAAIGRVREEVTPQGIRKVCTVRYTFDERIEDGLYCAHALGKLQARLEAAEFS